jgi:hypothetical protein
MPTKGALAAIAAFNKGDVINGTAAVMDICASLAPFIGGLSAAGGPPGILIGAIFGMVAQILSFFGPKGESLKETLEKLLRQLNAEQKQQDTVMNARRKKLGRSARGTTGPSKTRLPCTAAFMRST